MKSIQTEKKDIYDRQIRGNVLQFGDSVLLCNVWL